MTLSLHASLFLLSPILGVTEPALYERQKALVRKGLLPRATGSGRGNNGPVFNKRNVSLLMATVVISDSLAEIRDEDESTIEQFADDIAESMGRDGRESAVTYGLCSGSCATGPSIIVERTLHPMAIYEVAQLLKAGT